jgi:putative hydrolase of the HAD superfamily
VAVRGLSPRVLLLDALGTLVALLPVAPRLRRELHDRFGLEVSAQDADRAVRAEIVYYRAHLDEGRDEASLADLRRRCAGMVHRELAGRVDQALPPPQEIEPALLAALRFRAFPDAEPALSALRARGLRTVVVSNWDISLPGVLERVGLGHGIDHVITSAGAGVRKPAPRPFELALRWADARPEEAIHVGDSLAEDVAGARGAGIDAILIDRDFSRGQPPDDVPTIASLNELPALLARPA